jgi:3-oxoacyl-[acyl-carrier-protein] synthase III
MPATITSIAHYAPPNVVTNAHYESYLDTTDDWIVTRTGIKERHIATSGATSDLIVPAAIECVEKRGISMKEIDCVVVATVTPDHFFPSTMAVLHRKLGLAQECWGFDLSAACSGFVFALITAAKLVESGAAKKLLLCGSDKMSTITDFQDRSNCVLFGDAAGVCLIENSNEPGYGILDFLLRVDGAGNDFLYQIAGGSAKPASIETVQNGEHYLYQDGQVVFKAAVKGMADISTEIMRKNNLTADDIDWFVPHQANFRIIKSTGERMGLNKDKVIVNIDRYGNTTAATIPMCMSEWHNMGKIKKGDNIIISSFGAGYTWGAIWLKWNMNK